MKIKIVLIAALFLAGSPAAFAQSSDAEADAVANLLGVQKREIIAKLVPVSGKDSVSFWKIYDEYQQTNKQTAKTRIKLYEGTAQAYQNLTSVVADSLAKQYFSNRLDQENSLEIYYKKIKTATNPVVAFEFYQAEIYLLTQIRAQIMHQIPVYGALRAPEPNK
jgi:hypothetical protein